jgi:ATP synthase protein I
MPDKWRSYRESLQLSTVGIALAVAIALGTGGGIWLDNHFGTQPAFTVVGFLLGTIAGFRELFRAVKRR